MRRLVLGLLALNVLTMLWLGLREGVAGRQLPASDDGLPVTVAPLVLLAEVIAPGPRLVERCWWAGPFDDESRAESLAAVLEDRGVWRVVQMPYSTDTLHRVYLPAEPGRQAALDLVAELRRASEAAGMSMDSYIVSGGDLDNAISLGLFSDVRNALRVQTQVQALGYSPVIALEERQSSRFWLVIGVAAVSDNFLESMRAQMLDVTDFSVRENLCEMIAHQEQFP